MYCAAVGFLQLSLTMIIISLLLLFLPLDDCGNVGRSRCYAGKDGTPHRNKVNPKNEIGYGRTAPVVGVRNILYGFYYYYDLLDCTILSMQCSCGAIIMYLCQVLMDWTNVLERKLLTQTPMIMETKANLTYHSSRP